MITAEGGIGGAALGCGIGFLAGGTKGCIGGAIGGGVAGTAAGYYVASRTQAAKETEDQYASQIVQAGKDADSAQKVADASQTVADDAAQKISALKAQLKNQQITVAQYDQSVQHFQNDSQMLADNIADTQKKLNSTNILVSANRGTPEQRQALVKAQQRLQLALKKQQEQSQSISSVTSMS
ncbi:hypothetical protein [Acetobacter persici]|uniref:hypothetical protein n=1 Tax=Acetobacter persici TaxID=1076596 RepID=UPI001BAC82FF|nr:hypothetical protein [Acetobacter persici]MBS1016969.1 hypothetical protein [Acetobacter persici]